MSPDTWSAQADDFRRDGLLVIPGFLSPERCDVLSAACHAHYRGQQARAHHDCEVIPWDPVADGAAPFIALLEDPRLATLTASCLGTGFNDGNSLAMLSPPGGVGQAWHQDCPTEDKSRYNCNRLFYLEDVDRSQGAVVAVPGSHRGGRIPPGDPQEDLTGQHLLEPRKGTLILLHGNCYHRVTPNRSDSARLSLNLRAFPPGCPLNYDSVGLYRNHTVDFTTGRSVAVEG